MIPTKTFFEPASRPKGDEHIPTILEWHNITADYEEPILASIKILVDVPQTTREEARAYAKEYINELLKEPNQ